MYLLPIPNDVLDDHPEGQPLLLHRHVVHGTGKGLEHIPHDLKGLCLEVLFLQNLLQLPDVPLDAFIPF